MGYLGCLVCGGFGCLFASWVVNFVCLVWIGYGVYDCVACSGCVGVCLCLWFSVETCVID